MKSRKVQDKAELAKLEEEERKLDEELAKLEQEEKDQQKEIEQLAEYRSTIEQGEAKYWSDFSTYER